MANKDQPFCVVCATERELSRESKQIDYEVRGETVSVELPMTICPVCGTEEVDESFEKDPTICAYDIYRKRHQLLSSEKIKSLRETYQLSQKAFACLIGMSESSVNRYEAGVVQDTTQDTAMCAFESAAFVLGAIARRGKKLSLRQRKKTEKAIAEIQSRTVTKPEFHARVTWGDPLAERVGKFATVQALVNGSTWGSTT